MPRTALLVTVQGVQILKILGGDPDKDPEVVEIMDALELPISGNQISLEISFEGFLKELDGRITNAPR